MGKAISEDEWVGDSMLGEVKGSGVIWGKGREGYSA